MKGFADLLWRCMQLGKTTVPISEPLAEEMKCFQERSMTLIGFMRREKVRTELFLGVGALEMLRFSWMQSLSSRPGCSQRSCLLRFFVGFKNISRR